MTKKIMALALCLLMLTGFAAGCSGSSDGGSSVLTIYTSHAPVTLDPTYLAAPGDAVYAAHLFETLMAYTDSFGEKLEVAAAESYVVSHEEIDGEMRQVITFKIRQSGWSDGLAVKADDFAFAIERLVSPQGSAPYSADLGRYFYKGLDVLAGRASMDELGVEVVDDTTLKCVMAFDREDNLKVFAAAQLSPVRRDVIDQHGDAWTENKETFVTNGPFQMDVYTPGDVMRLEKNKRHWFRANIENGTLLFTYVDEKGALDGVTAQEAIEEEKNRQAVVADILPQDENSLSVVRAQGLLHSTVQKGTLVVEMNQREGPFNDADVREALTRAVDPSALPLGNGDSPAYALVGSLFQAEGRAYPSEALLETDVAQNVAKAQEALSRAGYDAGANFPAVTLLCEEDSSSRAVADSLAATWKATLGIEVAVEAKDAKALNVSLRTGNFQMALVEKVASYDDPAALLAQYDSGSGNNASGYASDAFDAKLAEAVAAQDPPARIALMREAETLLLADYAVAPVFFPAMDLVYAARIVGMRVGPYGQYFVENAHKVEMK